MRTLNDAIALATELHAGQLDKQGMPYILHPLRVMMAVLKFNDMNMAQAAVLHDVVEDTGTTLADLDVAGYDDDVVNLVAMLSRVESETYEAFIANLARSPRATKIKIADICDNLSRPFASAKFDRLRTRYQAAMKVLRPGEFTCAD